MLEKIPKTVPIDFGTSHGNELLNFFDTCRRRGIGTDIELTVNGEKLKGISFAMKNTNFMDFLLSNNDKNYSKRDESILSRECYIFNHLK